MEDSSAQAKVIVSVEGAPDRTVDVGELLSIGRSSRSGLMLDDSRASRNHAEIRRVGDCHYRLHDLHSANGTWLNGRRVAAPKDLSDGDVIQVGSTRIRFSGPAVSIAPSPPTGQGTSMFLRREQVISLVADIRKYSTMSESLPNRQFSRLISDWFGAAGEVIGSLGGVVDKFMGDAVMAYWLVAAEDAPAAEVQAALEASRRLIARASEFARRIEAEFPGETFAIGIGLNLGEAVLGNVGIEEAQSFTVVGDSVNVAFRLESATKEKGYRVIASRSIVEHAGPEFAFHDLGPIAVKGRKAPVPACALELGDHTRY